MQNRLVSVPVLDQPQCRRYKALNIPVTLQPKFTATEIMHNIFFFEAEGASRKMGRQDSSSVQACYENRDGDWWIQPLKIRIRT